MTATKIESASASAAAGTIRILIAEDHQVVRQGFIALLNMVDGLQVVAEASNGQQAIELFRQHKPDVTLMDLRMPGMAGVETITAIRGEFPEARIIVLTTFDGDEDIFRAIQAGARGYMLKGMSVDELIDAIQTVHHGRSKIPAAVAERLAERVSGNALTERETEVLKTIVSGKSNKEIAAALFISEATVKTHINNLLSKLGATDRTQAARIALQRGIVHLD
jgi:two-component system NarL family response regulator